jgi:CRP-like cAMP-binding protein
LAAVLSTLEVEPGAVLMREGEPASSFVLIVEGRAVVTRTVDENEKVVGTASRGAIVGELALLRGAPRGATVTAEQHLIGLVGGIPAFSALLDSPGVGARVTRAAAQRMVAEVKPVESRQRDDVEFLLRPMLPTDRNSLTEAIARLSPESRRRRFFTLGPLSDRVLDYLVDLDFIDHFAWMVSTVDQPERGLIASARYIRTTSDPETAEVAFGVSDDYQGRGIATLLLGALAITARENGVRYFSASVLAENVPMRSVLNKAGAKWSYGEPGVVTTVVAVPSADELIRDPATVQGLREATRQVMVAASVAHA